MVGSHDHQPKPVLLPGFDGVQEVHPEDGDGHGGERQEGVGLQVSPKSVIMASGISLAAGSLPAKFAKLSAVANAVTAGQPICNTIRSETTKSCSAVHCRLPNCHSDTEAGKDCRSCALCRCCTRSESHLAPEPPQQQRCVDSKCPSASLLQAPLVEGHKGESVKVNVVVDLQQ